MRKFFLLLVCGVRSHLCLLVSGLLRLDQCIAARFYALGTLWHARTHRRPKHCCIDKTFNAQRERRYGAARTMVNQHKIYISTPVNIAEWMLKSVLFLILCICGKWSSFSCAQCDDIFVVFFFFHLFRFNIFKVVLSIQFYCVL